ncbi:hypothetical protein ARMSODRAFT_320010 [Armillaria solidipes]|uniref:Uncharacterized protein n=1 Tax=Armillaria solidipes TaxID=1076256 RepID=A0A2H3BE03_9AGAR|nr:hypothetical protein ARMSODRAFT_320010 [Armillaria solidipes]
MVSHRVETMITLTTSYFMQPASIDQIVDTKASDRHTASAQPSVSVRPVGRISDLDVLPLSEIKDERHVFLTDSEKTVSVDVTDLIRVCLAKQVESYAPGELFSTPAWIISILEGCIIFIDGNVVTLNPIMPCRRLNYSYSKCFKFLASSRSLVGKSRVKTRDVKVAGLAACRPYLVISR